MFTVLNNFNQFIFSSLWYEVFVCFVPYIVHVYNSLQKFYLRDFLNMGSPISFQENIMKFNIN